MGGHKIDFKLLFEIFRNKVQVSGLFPVSFNFKEKFLILRLLKVKSDEQKDSSWFPLNLGRPGTLVLNSSNIIECLWKGCNSMHCTLPECA